MSKSIKSKSNHQVFLIMLIVILLVAAVSGWIMYFVRVSSAQKEQSKLKQVNEKIHERLSQYEDVELDDILSDLSGEDQNQD